MEGKPKSVGIWIRVSTEDQAQGDSPEHHEKRARYYAESKNWNVKEVYHLEAVSGKSVMEHPECQRMLRDIRAGHIEGLIFSKLARVARNTRELLDFADIFREANADLISLQESIDTSTPAGRLFYTMIAAMAQWEREEIASRVQASIPIRAKLGKPLGGSAQFGYQWVDKKLVPDPKEAPIRKLLHELFAEHKRIRTVAKLLNEMGHRTRNGCLFTPATVRWMLLDPTPKGIRRANYSKQGKKGYWEIKPEDEWVYSEVEPIVSEEVWNTCYQLLQERKSKSAPAKRTVHLLSGLIYCVCGNKMYVPSNTPKYVCQKCRNKIGGEDAEAVFHEQLKGFFFSSEEITKYLEGADQVIKDKLNLMETLKQEREKAKRDMEKIKRLYLEDQISPQGFGSEYKPLEARINQIDDQLPAIQGEIDFLRIRLKSSDEILSEAQDLYSRWPQMTPEEKRKVVESITERITIGQGEITIDLCYLPSATDYLQSPSESSSEMMANGARTVLPAFPFCHLTLKAPKPKYRRRKRVLTTDPQPT